MSRQLRSASAALANPSGSSPAHRSDPVASTHASRRAANVTALPGLPRRARLNGPLVRSRPIRHLDPVLVLGRTVRADARDVTVEDHGRQPVDGHLLTVAVALRSYRHGCDIATDTGSARGRNRSRLRWGHSARELGTFADAPEHLECLR